MFSYCKHAVKRKEENFQLFHHVWDAAYTFICANFYFLPHFCVSQVYCCIVLICVYHGIERKEKKVDHEGISPVLLVKKPCE